MKRWGDIFLSIALLLVTFWLFILIIFVYILFGQRPVFFVQHRIGKGEHIFTLIKFRTLKDVDLPLQQRQFWLGDFLRFTSLDELPQLINILKGDMTFIGPRPLPKEYLPLFSAQQRIRHKVLPGLTGLAQVSGRHTLSWEEKFKYDIYYVNNISLALNFKIMIRTFVLIFSFKKDTSLLEQRFKGSDNA